MKHPEEKITALPSHAESDGTIRAKVWGATVTATTNPDPAAVEAARKCVDIHYFNGVGLAPGERFCATCGNYLTDDVHLRDGEKRCDRAAAIIESATHVGELREALEQLTTIIRQQEGMCIGCGHYGHNGMGRLIPHPSYCAYTRAESVLAKLGKEGQ